MAEENRYTVWILPQNRARSRSFNLSKKIVIVSVVILNLLLLTSCWMVYDYVNLKQKIGKLGYYKSKSADLQDKVLSLARDLTLLRGKVDSNQKTLSQFEVMVGAEGTVGVGGLDTSTQKSRINNPLIDTYKNNQDQLISEMWNDLESLEVEISRQEIHQNLLKRFFDEHRQLLSSLPSIKPLDGAWLSSGFGYRKDPFTGKKAFHRGLDFSSRKGSPIHSTADGIVTMATWDSDFGRTVQIDHGFGFQTRYSHLLKMSVKVGDKVSRGDLIGTVGSSGRATSPHLHYEVMVNNNHVNPINYILDFTS